MLHALTVIAAVEGEESPKTLFYIAGGLLAVFAVVVSVIGIRAGERFPASKKASRGVLGLAALLVVAAMAAAVVSS